MAATSVVLTAPVTILSAVFCATANLFKFLSSVVSIASPRH